MSAPRESCLPEGPGPRVPPPAPDRFHSCRCAAHVVPEGAPAGAPPEPARYRRCPVGAIADLDCPEWVGVRCRFHEDRGGAPPTVLPAGEVEALAAEVARDFLTPRYRRRLAALASAEAAVRRGQDLVRPTPHDARPVEAPPRRSALAGAPVNVPADRAARRPAPGAGAGERPS